ncbi:hypothetical protein Kpho02_50700 [Kitasatospora phosalacinea]|uniref:Uncharacterized protein n=1 Tax=Kitasatospora phosalacinea TaxID=2065 RepID=A0A9W6QD34_9ACTN|nr:hypothetical protein Kpho02_50700 [Kitasatospora phosalacinea]
MRREEWAKRAWVVSAADPARTSPQNGRRPRSSVTTSAFIAFIRLLPGTKRSRPGGRPVGPDLADGAGDDGAVRTEPAGQDVVGDPVPQVDERDREPVDEDRLVLRTGTDRPPPRPVAQPGVPPGLPYRPQPGHQVSDQRPRQAGDPSSETTDARAAVPTTNGQRAEPTPATADRAPGRWSAGVDSTVVRAHQHAAGARTDPPPVLAPEGAGPGNARTERLGMVSSPPGGGAPGGEGLGRSRGGSPSSSTPFGGGRTGVVMSRNIPDDSGAESFVTRPDRQPDSTVPGAHDPHARPLLLLPALGDEDAPADAAAVIAGAPVQVGAPAEKAPHVAALLLDQPPEQAEQLSLGTRPVWRREPTRRQEPTPRLPGYAGHSRLSATCVLDSRRQSRRVDVPRLDSTLQEAPVRNAALGVRLDRPASLDRRTPLQPGDRARHLDLAAFLAVSGAAGTTGGGAAVSTARRPRLTPAPVVGVWRQRVGSARKAIMAMSSRASERSCRLPSSSGRGSPRWRVAARFSRCWPSSKEEAGVSMRPSV